MSQGASTILDTVLSELEFELEHESEGEYESATSWFSVEAFQLSPFFAQLADPQRFQGTPDYAQNMVTGACNQFSKLYPASKIGICLRWTGSSWVKCASLLYSPCTVYP